MRLKINFLKFCLWCGAVIDALIIVPMVFPRVGALIFGLCDFNPGVEYKFAMYIGASLMLG